MASTHRLANRHADGVAAQPRPCEEEIKWQRTPLGICHGCTTVVYAGERLALSDGYLLHGACMTTDHRHPAGGLDASGSAAASSPS